MGQQPDDKNNQKRQIDWDIQSSTMDSCLYKM